MTERMMERNEWSPTRQFMPVIMGKNLADELDDKEVAKIDLFEIGLAKELKKDETIEQAVSKIVKMAIAAEFGPSLVATAGAKPMIDTITRGILADGELRKQALMIMDRFAHA